MIIRSFVLGLGIASLAGCSFLQPSGPDAGAPPPPPPAYSAPAAPAAPATSLHRGSPGHGAVVSLQRKLQERGYYWGPVDGVYGPATKAAVMNFQRDLGLPVTGVAGHQEWAALGLSGGDVMIEMRPEPGAVPSPDVPR